MENLNIKYLEHLHILAVDVFCDLGSQFYNNMNDEKLTSNYIRTCFERYGKD